MITIDSGIRVGSTHASNPVDAARELCAALDPLRSALVVTFTFPGSSLASLGRELHDRMPGVPLIGCTTAGEIGPEGYQDGSTVAVSFPRAHFTVVRERIDGLGDFSLESGQRVAGSLSNALRRAGKSPSPSETFALLLIDGLSVREEIVASSIMASLGELHLIGGSAGDGLDFTRTSVLWDGEFRPNRAVVALLHTDLPFWFFKTQHFVPSEKKLVVTGARAGQRIVTELNGEPAAEEYARAIGVSVDDLDPTIFATHPLVVRIGGDTYVRAVQKRNSDGSLTLFCAIEEGLVLTVAAGVDLLESLRQTFERVRQEVGTPEMILGCDCILRRIEIEREDLRGEVDRLFARNQVVGFATYGEQVDGIHVNQTFTGVAIGAPRVG